MCTSILTLNIKIRHLGKIKTCERQGKCKHEHRFKDKCEGEREVNVNTNMKVYVSVNVKEGEC